MKLLKKDIEKFQEICRTEFNKKISYERAEESGRKLINLIKLPNKD